MERDLELHRATLTYRRPNVLTPDRVLELRAENEARRNKAFPELDEIKRLKQQIEELEAQASARVVRQLESRQQKAAGGK